MNLRQWSKIADAERRAVLRMLPTNSRARVVDLVREYERLGIQATNREITDQLVQLEGERLVKRTRHGWRRVVRPKRVGA